MKRRCFPQTPPALIFIEGIFCIIPQEERVNRRIDGRTDGRMDKWSSVRAHIDSQAASHRSGVAGRQAEQKKRIIIISVTPRRNRLARLLLAGISFSVEPFVLNETRSPISSGCEAPEECRSVEIRSPASETKTCVLFNL